MISHEIMAGKVHVYLRDTSPIEQCATFLKGRNHRISTKEEGLEQAKQVAEEWYIGLRGKDKAGIQDTGQNLTSAVVQSGGI